MIQRTVVRGWILMDDRMFGCKVIDRMDYVLDTTMESLRDGVGK